VLVVGEGGVAREVNCHLDHTEPEDTRLPNYLGLSDGGRTLGSLCTDDGVMDAAHAQSSIAVCTIERLNLACVALQHPDRSVVMRSYRMEVHGSETLVCTAL
jgi:hypothetical protein